jgi:hypothetical protein
LLPKVARIVLVILVMDFVAALLPRLLPLAAVFNSPWLILLKIVARRTRPTGIGPSGLTEIRCPRSTDIRRARPAKIRTIARARCAGPIARANRSAAHSSARSIRGKLTRSCAAQKISSRTARPHACSNGAGSPDRAASRDGASRRAGDVQKIA